MIITSKAGKKINIQIKGDSVVASAGPVEFSAVRTAAGFKSRFLVPEAGNVRIEVILAGDDLSKAHAMFDELDASIKSHMAELREHDRRYNQVANALAQ